MQQVSRKTKTGMIGGESDLSFTLMPQLPVLKIRSCHVTIILCTIQAATNVVVHDGVRQGDYESPKVFKQTTDEAIAELAGICNNRVKREITYQ
jgi:hypothetical protein